MDTTASPTTQNSPAASQGRAFIATGYHAGFALIVSLFFLWAVANNFNDILIRHFQKSLDINRAQAGYIQFAFYLGYFLMALPAGYVTRLFGYRAGIVVGLSLYAAGALLFYPAADARLYGYFLLGLFTIASGAAFLETAANPYIIAFGDRTRAAQRLNLAQSFNGLGATIAPAIGGMFIFSGIEHSAAQMALMTPEQLDLWRASEARMVQTPYLVLAGSAFLLALAMLVVKLPKPGGDEMIITSQDVDRPHVPTLKWAVITQFFYVGAQVGVWSFFVDFVKDVAPTTPEKQAAFGLSASLFLFMVGRFVGTAIMHRVNPDRLLLIFALGAAMCCALAATLQGTAAIVALGCCSFFMSIMFPTIFSLGIRDLGKRTELGSSLLVMAVIGGAMFPPFMGWLSEETGSLRLAMLVPFCSFVVVMIFARWAGSAIGQQVPTALQR